MTTGRSAHEFPNEPTDQEGAQLDALLPLSRLRPCPLDLARLVLSTYMARLETRLPMSDESTLVAVLCTCCQSFDKTQNTPMVGYFRRQAEIWRCAECTQPCTNRMCSGFQTETLSKEAYYA